MLHTTDTPRLLDTTALVRVRAAVNPFGLDNVDLNVPEGLTLAQIFEIAQPDPIIRRSAHIFIGEHYIPQENWARVKPKAGDKICVTIRAFIPPQGGDRGSGAGKNILRAILMIGVMAAALFLGPALGALIAPAGFLGMTSAGVGQAIIGMVGMMAINALVPAKSGQTDGANDPQTFFIEGARNRANPFGAIPVLFGRHRMVPNLATRPYTEIVGDDQYLRMVFCWGIGPIDIDTATLKIGETALSEFTDYEIEHREGYVTDDPLTLFPGVVDQEQLSILLTATDGYSVRTTSDDADEISVDLAFFAGLVSFDNRRNEREEATCQIQIEYSVTGADTWVKIPHTGGVRTFSNSWINDLSSGAFSLVTFRGKKTSAIRHCITWKTPTRGQYDVRIKRVTTDQGEDSKISDEVTWATLRRITNESPINSPVPLALTAIRIKATDQLNGVIEEFNGVVTRVADDWDDATDTWIERTTRNPAAAFRHVLQGAALQAPYSDSRINLVNLAEWHEYCDAMGFHYDYIHDATSSVWDRLTAIAAAGRASPGWVGGKIGVIIDKAKLPVSHVTPRNSSGFSIFKPYIDYPHFFRIRFPNEDEGYRQDELRVYINGYTAETGTKSETMYFEGVVEPDVIAKHGRFTAAVGIHRPERWSFRQDLEYLAYSRGDVLKVTHDVLLIGKASGRIKSVTLDGSNNVTAITVDETLVIEGGDTYGVSIRTPGDVAVTATISNGDGSYNTVAFVTPIPAAEGVTAGDLFGFGLLGEETDEGLVISIEPESELAARIVCVPYREIVYTIDDGVIPPFDTNIIPYSPVTAPVVVNTYSIGPGSYLVPRVGLAVVPPIEANLILDVQIQPDETAEPYTAAYIVQRTENGVIIGDVQVGDVINLRCRWRGAGITPTAWTYVLDFTVELVEPFALVPAGSVDSDSLDGEIGARIQQIVSQIPNELQWLRDELVSVGNNIAAIYTTVEEGIARVRMGAGAQYAENAAGVELNATAVAGLDSALAQLFVGLFAITDAGEATVNFRAIAASLPEGALASVALQVAAGDGINFATAALELIAYYSEELGYYSEAKLYGDFVKLVVGGTELPANLIAVQDKVLETAIVSGGVTVDLSVRRELFRTILNTNVNYLFPTFGNHPSCFRYRHILQQDATGGRTVTFGSEFIDPPTIGASANAATMIEVQIIDTDPEQAVVTEIKQWSVTGGDLPIASIYEYTIPGTYSFTVFAHNTIKIEAWGAGGAGGSAGAGSTARSGSGSQSKVDFPALAGVGDVNLTDIVAGGGEGGDGVRNTSNPPDRGDGGTATGGDTNTTGGNGNNGQDGGTAGSTTGKGGDAPGTGGGLGGARPSSGDRSGVRGASPGGGGSGGWNVLFGGDNLGGGGGAGAYSMRDESAGVIKTGIVLTITVGTGGVPSTSGSRTGGYGANGMVRITIT